MILVPEQLHTLGNTDLLNLPKTAFFCSREYPPAIERGTYVWALEQRYRGNCVVSGFHSQLEQAVFRYLLQGARHPIVYVLGRGIQPKLSFEYGPEIDAGRLLFVSPFAQDVATVTQETADQRNLLITELAGQFFAPYLTPGGNLERLLTTAPALGKPMSTLDIPENQDLLQRHGFQIFQPRSVFSKPGSRIQP